MADIGKERGLGAVDLRQCFDAPLLILVGLGVADRGAKLTRHQAEKASVVVVRQAKRIEPRDQESGPSPFHPSPGSAGRWPGAAGSSRPSGEGRVEVLRQIGDEAGIAVCAAASVNGQGAGELIEIVSGAEG